MKVTYSPTAKTKFTTRHRLESKCFFRSMQVIDLDYLPDKNGAIHAPIDARFYGTGKTNSAALWIHREGIHASGSGIAGGYGYHRPSAALQKAIENAGFTLSEEIAGVGESAMREALLAIASEIGIKRPALVESFQ